MEGSFSGELARKGKTLETAGVQNGGRGLVDFWSRVSNQEKDKKTYTKQKRNDFEGYPETGKNSFLKQLAKDLEYLAEIKKEMNK